MRHSRSRFNQSVMRGIVALALAVLLVCYLFLTLVSCNGAGPRQRVAGTITGAADSVLVLERLTLTGIEPLDSVRLTDDGSFGFTVPAYTDRCPSFYRLRIAGRLVNFAVDSLEDMTVNATFARMAQDYEVEGNETSRSIKTISLLNQQLQMQLQRLFADSTIPLMQQQQQARQLVDAYKTRLREDYILRAPASAAAYFALFQTIGPQMLFDPETDRSDVRCFAAVATQWEVNYPYARRTENLRNIALRGMRNTRPVRTVELALDSTKVHETGIIDFGFPDIDGTERRLSDFGQNVVLLDFTAYSLPQSQERNLQLRELYDSYHSQGLEIVQVSVDADAHYWKTKCEQLPWVCLFCEEGIGSDILLLYGVQQLPAYFLVGRGSELIARQEAISDIRHAIETAL